MLFEDAGIQPRLDFRHVRVFAQEVGGKGRCRDDVVAGRVDVDVGKIRRARLNQCEAHRAGKLRQVFTQYKKVHHVVFPRRLFHEVAVTVGEGIGVHDDGGDAVARHVLPAQRLQVMRQAAHGVFEEIEGVVHMGDVAEAEVTKGVTGIGFGINVAGTVATRENVAHQAAHQFVEEAAALVGAINSDTFQDVAVAGARGNQGAVVAVYAIHGIKIGFAPDAFALQEFKPGDAVGGDTGGEKLLHQRQRRLRCG